MSQLCKACQASGLPIMPVRYAVVPKSVAAKLPDWASGARVKDIALGDEFHYALRTLRAGYVYLYYSKNARGAKQWECYTVTEDGLLLLQLTPKSALEPKDSMTCKTAGHSNSRLHHLIIDRPDDCGPTWIAFSEHKWSDETLAQYGSDAKLRSARMQAIDPKAMAAGAKNPHSSPASQAALESIMEYSPGFSSAQLPYDQKIPQVSSKNGGFKEFDLKRVSSYYVVCSRKGNASETLQFMQTRAKKSSGASNTPHVMALWDAIGTVHELNGFRNEPAGVLKQYGIELEFQINAMTAIEGLKQAMAEKAGKSQQANQDQMLNQAAAWYKPEEMAKRRASSSLMPEPKHSQRLEVCNILEQWAQQQVPYMPYPQRLEAIDMRNIQEPQRSQQISALKAEVTVFLSSRKDNYDKNIKYASSGSWSKYEKKLKIGEYGDFKKNYDKLFNMSSDIIDARTDLLIKWLDSTLFIDTLEDYHHENTNDGVYFEDVIGNGIFGISSSAAGAKKIDIWVKDAKASDKKNILWRAIAMNQKVGIKNVDALLTAASGPPVPFTEKTLAAASDNFKYVVKIAELGKKGLGLHNTLRKDGVKAIPTGGLEKILLTVGERFFAPFMNKRLDTMGEKLVQALLLGRAGCQYAAIMGLLAVEAKMGTIGRTESLLMLSMGTVYANKKIGAEYKTLKDAWANLIATVDEAKTNANPKLAGGFNDAKDLRFGLVTTILQGLFVLKLLEDVENQPKSKELKATLLMAQLSLGAGAIDLGATVIKGLSNAKDAANSFQLLKLSGGLLSAGAGWIAMKQGGSLSYGAYKENKYKLFFAYGFKTVADGLSAGFSLLASFSYTAPAMQALKTRFPTSLAAKGISNVMSRLFAWRAVLLFGSLAFSLVSIGITIAIWYFDEDELQEWCDQSAFGLKDTDTFPSIEEQQKQFEKALVKVLST
ncbi:hypothetical protein VN23_06980 [Janthinobacterium sp. B9-8]|nr:hypothetical protein VN23_06980 [Janthinobacterium sp. B9-8]